MFDAVKKFIVSLFTQTQQLLNSADSTLSDDMYQSIRRVAGPVDSKKDPPSSKNSDSMIYEDHGLCCGHISPYPFMDLMSISGSISEARINPLSKATGTCSVSEHTQG